VCVCVCVDEQENRILLKIKSKRRKEEQKWREIHIYVCACTYSNCEHIHIYVCVSMYSFASINPSRTSLPSPSCIPPLLNFLLSGPPTPCPMSVSQAGVLGTEFGRVSLASFLCLLNDNVMTQREYREASEPS
jgi:hypothetical protein